MRRAFGWMAGLVGIAALARVLARRSRRAPAAVEPDPANELRRKLSETREVETNDAPGAPAGQEQSETLDERRSRVHAKAQQAIEAMQDQTT